MNGPTLNGVRGSVGASTVSGAARANRQKEWSDANGHNADADAFEAEEDHFIFVDGMRLDPNAPRGTYVNLLV
jgi:hypothetical protein